MRAFTFMKGTLIKGLQVEDHERLGKIVKLGNGQGEQILRLDLRNPAVPMHDVIYDADPHEVKPKSLQCKTFLVLRAPLRGSRRFLVRVNTELVAADTVGGGTWKYHKGTPIIHEGAEGVRNNGSLFSDDILEMKEGDGIIINSEIPEEMYLLSIKNGEVVVKKSLRSKTPETQVEAKYTETLTPEITKPNPTESKEVVCVQ